MRETVTQRQKLLLLVGIGVRGREIACLAAALDPLACLAAALGPLAWLTLPNQT